MSVPTTLHTPTGDADYADIAVVPSRALYRNAWRLTGTVIGYDKDVLREVFRERIREARKPKFEKIDTEALPLVRKIVQNGTALQKTRLAELEVSAQKLRDAPNNPAITAAQTPEELEALWPTFLN